MNTKHNDRCKRIFARYDMECPRCRELAGGAAPRDGWQKFYFENSKKQKQYRDSWRMCDHNNINPGGYCNTCGAGRDFS